ncbi:zinc finger BED domain-containing protein RICESLEEPER 3-like [Ziziphus jujuba]|uniref:Zinc finger BED domain-containing protein RICESLEEPER 3-like n=1 Tax=Ziziphus jujuba TaxID=326968 RepID=A0ABM4AGG6_ZIZJJ|nr:zinc finger BED domain-containing protein RICESLEEPER 3-like [Ziziphus jujuba]
MAEVSGSTANVNPPSIGSNPHDKDQASSTHVSNSSTPINTPQEIPSQEEQTPIEKVNAMKYPTLHNIARDILAIPVSTIASESTFSTGGRFVSPHRSRLHPKTVEAFMCAQDWLWAEVNASSYVKPCSSTISDIEINEEVRKSSTICACAKVVRAVTTVACRYVYVRK